jgi:DNA-binding LytR/AlgR family response regulator
VLITDIELPGSLDGVALGRIARQQRPTAAVVFISGSMSRLSNACITESPASCLLKPFSLSYLMGFVHHLAATSHPLGPVSPPTANGAPLTARFAGTGGRFTSLG